MFFGYILIHSFHTKTHYDHLFLMNSSFPEPKRRVWLSRFVFNFFLGFEIWLLFPGSNLNSNAKLCFLLLIWIQFQSFFKIVIPTHIQSFTPEFLFEFELKASFSNCYSYSDSNLKFSLRILMFEFIFYALFLNIYLNSNSKSGFRIFIWIRIQSLVYQLLFLF